MKRNLIIFLFTLLLGGLTCFNYSYASTVNVSESFCKNIQENYDKNLNSQFDNEWNNNLSSQFDNERKDKYKNYWSETEPDSKYFTSSREDEIESYNIAEENRYQERKQWFWKESAYQSRLSENNKNGNWLAATCESNGCLYFHEKCVACPWIRLNTDIPFIGNCIPTDSQSEIFPVFIGWLIKFATSLLLLVGFICIIVGGVMVTCGKDKEGKDLIKKVVYAMALLWASGVILKMINPNFFN